MESLLGQFYSRIKGSQEDIASEGLTYILQRSLAARTAVNNIILAECNLDLGDLNFRTQSTGTKLERPDISGYHIENEEVLIMEAKFWASLTENQPIAYLNRLHENSVLIFICPSLRVRSLYDELFKRLKNEMFFVPYPHKHAFTVEQNKHVIIKTWDEVLGVIKHQLIQKNEQTMISDIDQIIGFCNRIDNEAFLPLQSDDLSPGIARRINSYYHLVDNVVGELKKRGIADTAGYKSATQKYGYTKFFKAHGFGVSLNVKLDFWAKWADTPFWINVMDIITGSFYDSTPEFRSKLRNVALKLGITCVEYNSKYSYLPLFPPVDKTEDLVVEEIINQINKIFNALGVTDAVQ